MKINTSLVESREIVRAGIEALLKDSKVVHLKASIASYHDLKNKAVARESEVIVLERTGSYTEMCSIILDIKAKHVKTKIIILSHHNDTMEELQGFFQAGASGYISKNAGADELEYAVSKVHKDGLFICTGFILRLWEKSQPVTERANRLTGALSTRELEVLRLVAEGHTNQDIADRLFISPRTVESRRKKLLEKTGCKNTATLLVFATRHGLLA